MIHRVQSIAQASKVLNEDKYVFKKVEINEKAYLLKNFPNTKLKVLYLNFWNGWF